MNDPAFARLFRWTLIAALVVVCLFSAFPGLDIAIARQTYLGEGRFALSQVPGAQLVNDLLRHPLNIIAWLTVLVALGFRLAGVRPHLGRRNLEFAAFVIGVGPGLIVNALLKLEVGRARPAYIQEFGGDLRFTPMMQVTDQCSWNCSFSSGEVAMTSAAVMVVLALCWHLIPPRQRRTAVVIGAALIMLSTTLRLGLGRHFMSDALASVAISAFVTLWAWRLFQMDEARQSITSGAVRADLADLGRWSRARIRQVGQGARCLRRTITTRLTRS